MTRLDGLSVSLSVLSDHLDSPKSWNLFPALGPGSASPLVPKEIALGVVLGLGSPSSLNRLTTDVRRVTPQRVLLCRLGQDRVFCPRDQAPGVGESDSYSLA